MTKCPYQKELDKSTNFAKELNDFIEQKFKIENQLDLTSLHSIFTHIYCREIIKMFPKDPEKWFFHHYLFLQSSKSTLKSIIDFHFSGKDKKEIRKIAKRFDEEYKNSILTRDFYEDEPK